MAEAATNKRDRTSSPAEAPSAKESRIASSSPAAEAIDEAPEDEIIEADDGDSAFGDGASSEGTSIRSHTIRGYIENGRRYATLRGEGNVFLPSDDKQFEVFETTHLMYLILDSQRRNPLFQSPLSEKAQYALDIGTGDASWAIDVADKFPNLTVYGVDLYPPPKSWVPPNCILEVDNVLEPWTWNKKLDLINIRFLLGSFSVEEWKRLYSQAYDNLQPGGWIEQIEIGMPIYSDDGTLPADSHLAKLHEVFEPLGVKANKPVDVYNTFQGWIEEAGFINVHKTDYKVPYGAWPRLDVYKDAGRVGLKQMKAGLEGWMIWFLTKYAEPAYSLEEAQVYLALLRKELDSNWHIYQKAKRVWAQKPFDA